jgi:hypothetical protein
MSQDFNGMITNGARQPTNNAKSDPFALPGIDENKLRSRIYCKPQLSPYPKAIKFSGPTPVQERKVSIIVTWFECTYSSKNDS